MSFSDQCVYCRGQGSFGDVLEPSASLSGFLQTSKVSAPVLLQLQRRVPRLYLPIDCVLLCSKFLAPSLQVPVVTPTPTTTPPPPTTTKAPATTTKAPATTVAATAPPVSVSGARAPPVAVSGARGPATAAPLAGAPVTTSAPVVPVTSSAPAVPVTTKAPAVPVTTKAPAVPVTVAPATTRIITPGTPIGQVPAKDQAAVAAALAKGDTVVIQEAPAAPVRLHCIPAPAQHNIHGAGSFQRQQRGGYGCTAEHDVAALPRNVEPCRWHLCLESPANEMLCSQGGAALLGCALTVAAHAPCRLLPISQQLCRL